MFLDQVYGAAGKRRDKSQLHCNSLMVPGSLVSTPSHDLHRMRRGPLNPFFSKQSIRRLEPILQRCLEKVLVIFSERAESSKPINTKMLFSAATNDIIIEYAFGHGWNNLDSPDLNESFLEVMDKGSYMWHVSSYFPWVMRGLTALPESVAAYAAPGILHMIELNIVSK
jgi:cytochrome P450